VEDINAVEIYANFQEHPTRIMAFDSDKTAWTRMLGMEGWTEWFMFGSSVDYESNAVYAEMEGMPVKLDRLPW